jgi:hypothetical protein
MTNRCLPQLKFVKLSKSVAQEEDSSAAPASKPIFDGRSAYDFYTSSDWGNCQLSGYDPAKPR